MANAKLVDLSRWNGPADQAQPMVMQWDLARAQEVTGAIVRLGSINDVTGVCYIDDRLLEIVESASKAGVPLGYYYFSRPKHDGAKQGAWVLDTIRTYGLPVALDVWYDVESVGLSATQTRDSVLAAVRMIAAEYPRRTGIYTRQSFWDANVVADPFWPTLKLWAARYNTTLTGPWSDGRLAFRDWKQWNLWQYSADGNGQAAAYGFPSGSVSLDLNQYNGTEEQFSAYYELDPNAELIAAIEALTLRVTALEGGVTYLDGQGKAQAAAIEALKTRVQIAEGEAAIVRGTIEGVLDRLAAIEVWASSINYKKV